VGRLLIVVPTVFLFAFGASAQILPKGNLFVGYSYNRLDLGNGTHANFNGWIGSAELKVFPFVGIVGEVSGHYGAPNGVKTQKYNFLAGPRLSLSLGKTRLFIHALAGGARMSTSIAGFSDSDTSFAYAGGGGIEHKLSIFRWRVQGDYVHTRLFSSKEGDVRVSTGLVFNFF
jgi:hypothetical protein